MKEHQKNQILGVLKRQLKSIQEIKEELLEEGKPIKVALFRDYEKELENHIDFLIENQETEGERCRSSSSRLTKDLYFTREAKIFIEGFKGSITSKKMVLEILKQKNSVSNTLFFASISLQNLISKLSNEKSNDFFKKDNSEISFFAEKTFKTCFMEARFLDQKEISLRILFLSILRNETDHSVRLLNEFGINYTSVK